jgi:hypothetical protein
MEEFVEATTQVMEKALRGIMAEAGELLRQHCDGLLPELALTARLVFDRLSARITCLRNLTTRCRNYHYIDVFGCPLPKDRVTD